MLLAYRLYVLSPSQESQRCVQKVVQTSCHHVKLDWCVFDVKCEVSSLFRLDGDVNLVFGFS